MKVPSYFPENSVIEFGKFSYKRAGEWETEPDIVYWTDPATGYKCEIHRVNGIGHLCGYVHVLKGSKLFGTDYNDAYEFTSVHGGLTFADPLKSDASGWAFGFDCAHAGDRTPMSSWPQHSYEVYRNMKYVHQNVTDLAKQLHTEINKVIALPALEQDTVREFITHIFNVMTNDGELYRKVILLEISLIRSYGNRTPLCEYTIPDIWKRMASRLINHFRWSDGCEDRTHVFTTIERDMLADMLAEKYDEDVKEGL